MNEGKKRRLSPTVTYDTRKREMATEKKEVRNWLGLPSDIMAVIFSKLDLVDIMYHAQLVCSSWLQIAKDPQTFRSIRIRKSSTDDVWSKNILKAATERSCGQLSEVSMENGAICNDELLHYVTLTPSSLKSLKLATCKSRITGKELVTACRKLHLLEELEFTDRSCDLSCRDIEQVGQSCSQLKYLRIFGKETHAKCQSAFSVANNMPQLQVLRLYLTSLTYTGLQAILAGCPRLETLDLCDCCFLGDIGGSLLETCRYRIKDLTLPSGMITPLKVSRNCVTTRFRMVSRYDHMIRYFKEEESYFPSCYARRSSSHLPDSFQGRGCRTSISVLR